MQGASCKPGECSVKASTEDGVLSFSRRGTSVELVVSYRDPEQSFTLLEHTQRAVTEAIDIMRRRAVGEMERILGELLDRLLPQLSAEGGLGEISRTPFEGSPLWDAEWQENRLLVKTLPFRAHITASETGGSDRSLVEEYVRCVIRERDKELWEIYASVREKFQEELFSI